MQGINAPSSYQYQYRRRHPTMTIKRQQQHSADDCVYNELKHDIEADRYRYVVEITDKDNDNNSVINNSNDKYHSRINRITRPNSDRSHFVVRLWSNGSQAAVKSSEMPLTLMFSISWSHGV